MIRGEKGQKASRLDRLTDLEDKTASLRDEKSGGGKFVKEGKGKNRPGAAAGVL